ncbi:ATP-dependent helicase [Vibrio harveyi]|uniref:ATP-dependent helicase n=1 Tax=Vibrio harveyi TaxID=669 RepID=UPI0025B24EF3|nr:ATP-dependent helicase [Vibrio harveyi]WJT08346.1 ATP-dependent helicase [Vibrio harveyi]
MRERNIPSAYIEEALELNQNGQMQAYNSIGNCAVIAGTGSGKTKTLVLKVARMIDEDLSGYGKVACITYSRQCCKELEHRFHKLGLSSVEQLYIGTVHSFCLSQIVSSLAHLVDTDLPQTYTIATESQKSEMFNSAKEDVGQNANYCSISAMTSYRMTHLERDASFAQIDPILSALVISYEQQLRQNNLVDFDDLILISRKLILEQDWIRDVLLAKFPIIVVDEYQDLGKPLHDMVIALAEHGVRIVAVGDVDQSIYGFTGAHPELLNNLSERVDFENITMNLNYRSAQNIVTLSDGFAGQQRGILAHNHERIATIAYHLCPRGLEEQIEQALHKAMSYVSPSENRTLSDIAILYPTAIIGDLVSKKAHELGLNFNRTDNKAPYRKNPLTNFIEDCASWITHDWKQSKRSIYLSDLITTFRSFLEKSKLNDADSYVLDFVDYLWNSKNVQIELSPLDFLTRLMSLCFPSGMTPLELSDDFKEVSKMKLALAADGVLSHLNLQVFGNNRSKSDKLNLITYHSCKGCEYDVVIALGLDNGVFPKLVWNYSQRQWFYPSPSILQENRRLFFVALTRARYDVHFYKSDFFITSGGYRKNFGQSIFLNELQEKMNT